MRWLFDLLTWLGALNYAAARNAPLLAWLGRPKADARLGAALTALALLVARRRPRLRTLPLALLLQPLLGHLRMLWTEAAPDRLAQAPLTLIPAAAGPIPARLHTPAQPTTRAVLLVHGAGAHKDYFTWRLIDALCASSITVLAIDLDGHGTSPRTLDPATAPHAVSAALAHLRASFPTVGVVGISLGACVAGRALATSPAPAAFAAVEAPLRLVLPASYRRDELRGLARPAFWTSDDAMTPWQLYRRFPSLPVRTRHSTATTIAAQALETALEAIACPTLLLYGAADSIAPYPALFPNLARWPHATLQIIPDASHLSLTMEPAGIAALVAWLDAWLLA